MIYYLLTQFSIVDSVFHQHVVFDEPFGRWSVPLLVKCRTNLSSYNPLRARKRFVVSLMTLLEGQHVRQSSL